MLRYESSVNTGKGIAIFTGTFALVLLYFGLAVAAGASSAVLIGLALIFLVCTVIARTAKVCVSLDGENQYVEKIFSSALISRSWRYPLDRFSGVRVRSGGRGAFGEPVVVYFAELVGNQALRITMATSDKATAEAEAGKISSECGLPLLD